MTPLPAQLLVNTPSITTLDITGGAPELNPHYFRYLVSPARQLRGDDLEIIDRFNLAVLQEPGQEDLVDFLPVHPHRGEPALLLGGQRGRAAGPRGV